MVLRWNLQKALRFTIPKSGKYYWRLQGVFDFEISAEDMLALSALDKGHRFYRTDNLIFRLIMSDNISEEILSLLIIITAVFSEPHCDMATISLRN